MKMNKIKQTEVIVPEYTLQILNELLTSKQWVKGSANKLLSKVFKKVSYVNYNEATNSGTSALYVILKAMGLKEGAEVIVPANTFVATANAVILAGYKVIFCDVASDYNMKAESLEKVITDKTEAIIVVHLYGRPANMDTIMRVSNLHKIPIVEDCCQAHFSNWERKRVGTFGVASAYSFFPTKPINTIGEGGMASTNDLGLAIKIRQYIDAGRWSGAHVIAGMNMRMSEFQAMVIAHNIEIRDVYWFANETRQLVYTTYHNQLQRVKGIKLPPKIEGHTNHQFPIYCLRRTRESLQEFLHSKGIETSIKYPLIIPNLPAYKGSTGEWFLADSLARNTLCLPMHHKLSIDDVMYITDAIGEFYK